MKKFRTLLGWFGGLLRTGQQPVISIDDPDLRVVAESFDETEAASAALDRAEQWRGENPAVLRHYLIIPAQHVDTARELLAADGWTLRAADAATQDGTGQDSEIALHALRIQRLDALHCSQESSRMAGLAQRLRGRASGWDALQPGAGQQP